MAELADALVLGTSGHPVQVQVLLSAVETEKYRRMRKYLRIGTFLSYQKREIQAEAEIEVA